MEQSPDRSQLFIKKLTQIILANLENDKFGVSELAKELKISRSWLNRKVFFASGKTSYQFIHEFRLHKAIEILQNEDVTASEVAYRTGFSSPAYFNTCFHEFFGYPPGQVQKGDSKNSEDNIPGQVSARKEHRRTPGWGVIFTISGTFILVVLTLIFIYPGHLINFKRNSYEYLRSSGAGISVVVMPFQNMTNDTTLDVWQDGIQTNLITSLSENQDFKVRQIGTISGILQSINLNNTALFKPSVARSISQKLEANIFIQGSINQSSSKVRINAHLIETKKQEIFKSFQVDGIADSILPSIDSLSINIKNFLIMSVLQKKLPIGLPGSPSVILHTNSPEAYKYFVYGTKAFVNLNFPAAVNFYLQSIAIDSNFFEPYNPIVSAYLNQGEALHPQAKKWALKAYEKKDQMSMMARLYALDNYSMMFLTPYESINFAKQILEVDDQDAMEHYYLGLVYQDVYQDDKAIPEYEKALGIYKKWGVKPVWANFYFQLGWALHKTGQYEKEEKIYKKAERDFPDYWDLYLSKARLALANEDSISANRYIKRYKSIQKENSVSEADMTAELAWMYAFEGLMDKAEKYLRKALSLEPESPNRTAQLANFLIDKDRNIDEGLMLADSLLELRPGSYNLLEMKGWGLFKKGNYKEAMEVLQESWNLRIEKSRYNHKAYLHLEAVKKAVANQKN